MKTAMISELKNELSRYLRYVRRIDPVRQPSVASPDWPDQLERAGVLRGPVAALPSNWLADKVATKANVVGALLQERLEGR